jgi:hypothetical protein
VQHIHPEKLQLCHRLNLEHLRTGHFSAETTPHGKELELERLNNRLFLLLSQPDKRPAVFPRQEQV